MHVVKGRSRHHEDGTMTDASEWVRSRPNANGTGTEPDSIGRRRAIQGWTAALVMLCAGTSWLEFRHIESTLPYPQHVDEGFVSGPAHRTVMTGTLHPYTFNYPSLPKYLAAAGMAVGFLRGAAHLEIREIQKLGNVGYPYYETRRPMQSARQLFALLSAIALAATGLSAWLVFQRPATILLAPLILLTSPLFFFRSWGYLNVDIVGTCFVTLTLAACLLGTRRPTIPQSAIVPSVFAGFAAGSKYTLGIVALPVFLAIGLHFTGARRIWAWVAAFAATAAAFFVAVPYSLFDIPAFLNGLAFEAFHYASGHRGFSGEPGLPQLLYYARHFGSEFGVAAGILAVLGVAAHAVGDWRRTAVLAVFPTGLLWLLASQRVHFTRNVLSLYPLFAMFAAFGLVSLHGWVLDLAARQGWVAQTVKGPVRIAVALALVATTVPLWHFVDHLRDRLDSRNRVNLWIEENLPNGWTIVVPTQLGFDRRGIEASGRVVMVVDLQSARDAGRLQSLLGDVPSPAVIMVPRWGADARYPDGQKLADVLNHLSRRWRALETFGTNEVLVNYSYPNPRGDPAFAVAVLK